METSDKVILGIICAILIGLVATLVWAIIGVATDTSKSDFMTECKQYHKNYECVAMWRTGNKNTQMMPIVIPMSNL